MDSKEENKQLSNAESVREEMEVLADSDDDNKPKQLDDPLRLNANTPTEDGVPPEDDETMTVSTMTASTVAGGGGTSTATPATTTAEEEAIRTAKYAALGVADAAAAMGAPSAMHSSSVATTGTTTATATAITATTTATATAVQENDDTLQKGDDEKPKAASGSLVSTAEAAAVVTSLTDDSDRPFVEEQAEALLADDSESGLSRQIFAEALVVGAADGGSSTARRTRPLPVQSVQADSVDVDIDDDMNDDEQDPENDTARKDAAAAEAEAALALAAAQARKKRDLTMAIAACSTILTFVVIVAIVAARDGKSNSDDATVPSSNSDDEPPFAEEITAFINNITLTGRAIVPNNGSNYTEDVALQWLLDQNFELQLTPSNVSHRSQLQQRYALATLWVQKENDNNLTYFGSTVHECQWDGITCTDIDWGLDMGGTGAVTKLSLREFLWNGQLSDDMGLLSSMLQFDMFDNALSGPLPTGLGHWTNLTYFSIWSNALIGTLPEAIGNWTALRFFEVFDNLFTGTLPSAIAKWTNIEYFDVDTNYFRGSLPDWLGEWTAIELFDVGPNTFTGTIPATIANWSNIEVARFDSNNFTGSVPDFFCSNVTAPKIDFLTSDCDEKVVCACCEFCF